MSEAAALCRHRGFVTGQPLGQPLGGVTLMPLEARVTVQGIDSFVLSGAAFGDYYRSAAHTTSRQNISTDCACGVWDPLVGCTGTPCTRLLARTSLCK